MERTREQLYQEFKRSVTSPTPETPFFDETDLIDIFDYAGDQNDDATRTEVIALGQCLYPDSDPLRVRKAFYYYFIEREDMARALLEGEHERNPMWDILRLRLDGPEGEELDQRLQDLLGAYPQMDDETLIQLVDAANTLNRLDWVLAHIDELKRKTSYTPTLLYEVAVMSSMAGDNDTVIKLVDELTSIEPFYAPYWTMLARAYGEKDQYDEALNAVDYALAIDGEMTEALAIKTQLMLLRDMDVSELLPKLRAKAAEDPNNTMLIRTLGLAEQTAFGNEAAVKVYEHYLKLNPGNMDLMQSYLEIAEDIDFSMIRLFVVHCESLTEESLMQMAQHLAFEAHYHAIAKLLQAYHQIYHLAAGFEVMVTALYLAGEYREIEQLFDNPDEPLYTPRYTPMVSLIYALTLVRLRHKAKATKFIDEWIESNRSAIFPSPGERVRNTGVRYYMHTLRENMATLNAKELSKLDPILPISADTPPTF